MSCAGHAGHELAEFGRPENKTSWHTGLGYGRRDRCLVPERGGFRESNGTLGFRNTSRGIREAGTKRGPDSAPDAGKMKENEQQSNARR
ncbi:MAG: hypothetical protein WBQ89_26540 [Candidatus Acidiferrum sp.]